MYRIIGLWNDEEQYQDTPHNIGGQILLSLFKKKDFNFLKNSTSLFFSKKRNANISQSFFKNNNSEMVNFEVILPKTFMNYSGDVLVGEFSNKEKEKQKQIENVIVIYDDINLPFGEIKISFNRGDGGHNGVRDIIKKINSKNFIRIRIGVCPLDFFGRARKPKGEAVSKYLVNRKMSKKQQSKMPEIEKKVGSILEFILNSDYKKAMNKFN